MLLPASAAVCTTASRSPAWASSLGALLQPRPARTHHHDRRAPAHYTVLLQLTPADSNAWSAGVWTGLQRSSVDPSAWADGSGAQVGGTPWCPGEPNNKDGNENCAALVTICSSGAALVNDYPCGLPLRVVCAVDAAPECSQTAAPGPAAVPSQDTQYGWDHSGCTQLVSGCHN